jgi:hypothetical protein
VIALEIAHLLPELSRVSTAWKPPSLQPDTSSENKRWHRAITAELETAVTAETKRMSEWSKSVTANIDLDVEEPLDAVAAEVEAALTDVSRLGKGPTGRSDAFVIRAIETLRRVPEDDLRRVVNFFAHNADTAPWSERFAWVAHGWEHVTAAVDDLVRRADSYFEVIEMSLDNNDAAGDGSGPVGVAVTRLTDALTNLRQSLDGSLQRERS